MIFEKLVKQKFKVDIVSEFKFLEERKFRFDYAIPDLKIAIEQEGGVYTRGAHGSISGILRDIEKYDDAQSLAERLREKVLPSVNMPWEDY